MRRWTGILVRSLVLGSGSILLLGAGVYAGRVLPLGSGEANLSFKGELSLNGVPVTGPHVLEFKFKKASAIACASPPLDVTTDNAGAFQVLIPLGTCKTSLFDGTAVAADVYVDGNLAATDQPITHVAYAIHATQLGLSDCPVGFDRDVDTTASVVCKRGDDEVVRVGTGATAFWIDRYEASVWSAPDGAGNDYDGLVVAYPSTFPVNGQWTSPLYAASKRLVPPSVQITWFQALEACAASGKRLATGDEWLRAARGTPDGADCRVTPSDLRKTGNAGACVSAWGAEDMIGNAAEWTNEWYAGLGSSELKASTWPGPPFAGDYVINVASSAYVGTGSSSFTAGFPAAALRGGVTGLGSGSGIFALFLDRSPTNSEVNSGFRCVVPR